MADKPKTFEINLDAWETMASYMNWSMAVRNDDYVSLTAYMMAVVKEWPYEGDPSTTAAYANLKPAQFKAAVAEVGKAAKGIFRGSV